MSERKASVAATLGAARQELLAIVGGLSEAEWQRPTPCEGWSVRDLIAHLGSGETGNLSIARRILTGEDAIVADFDLNRFNQRQVEKRRDKSSSDLIADLAAAREQTMALLDELSDGQLAKPGRRTTGEETTVEGVFLQIARHDRMHADHIKAALG